MKCDSKHCYRIIPIRAGGFVYLQNVKSRQISQNPVTYLSGLLPRMNVMLDFICTLPVQLRRTRNKWTLQKNLVHGRIRSTNTARPPDYKSTVLTTRPQLAWNEMELNAHEIFINTIYKYINKLEKAHVYIASTICRFQPYNVWILLKTVMKYLHWQSAKQYRWYITVTGLGKLATCRCMYITTTICQLTGISLITYEFCLNAIMKYLHWSISKTIQMLYHVTVATAIHMYTMLILCTCVSSYVYL